MLPKPRKTKTAPQIKPKSDITTIINAFFTPNRHNSSGQHTGSGVQGKFVNTTFKKACYDFAIKIFIHQFQETCCGLMTGYTCVIGERGKWKGAGSAPLTVPQNQKLGIKAQPY